MVNYHAGNQWTSRYTGSGIAYPAEYVIRIFKGHYPTLKMPKPNNAQRALDVGCGDGRHVLFMQSLGLEAYGVEITQDLVDVLRANLAKSGVPPERLQVGSCGALPFEEAQFDYLLAWNSSYYMSHDNTTFESHAHELMRVLKPGGWLVLSVPKSTAFIFDGSDPAENAGYRIIRRDPFGIRNGEIMRSFEERDELLSVFSPYIDISCHGDIHDNCFGFSYHWFLLVARKRNSTNSSETSEIRI